MSIRKRGKHSFQVRVSPFPARTFSTMEAARRYQLELMLRPVTHGDLYVEKPQTLRAEVEARLARQIFRSTRPKMLMGAAGIEPATPRV